MLRFLSRMVIFFGVVVLITLAVFHVAVLEDDPLVAAATPPVAEDVRSVRELVRNVRDATNAETAEDAIVLTQIDQLNSLARMGARFLPGFRGEMTVQGTVLAGQVSLPVPWVTGRKWVNLSGNVPAFSDQVRFEDVRLGRLPIPGSVAYWGIRIGGDLVIGDGFGQTVLTAANSMEITGDTLALAVSLDDIGSNGIMRGVFGQLRGQEMPEAVEADSYYLAIREAIEDGRLPVEGSYLPYLTFTLQLVIDQGGPETFQNDYTAAIMALARACGARDFSLVIGGLAFGDTVADDGWRRDCTQVTFNDRIDTRRHFTTAAALQAASNRGFSVSIGEFKELHDTISGAGGFDFTDLAANSSGIRLSDVLMRTPFDQWPALVARLQTEADVVISFDDIPGLMEEDAFQAEYGGLDSPAYLAMADMIERRIDQLDLYAPQ